MFEGRPTSKQDANLQYCNAALGYIAGPLNSPYPKHTASKNPVHGAADRFHKKIADNICARWLSRLCADQGGV
jgi:hypothetical protein